MLKAFRKELEKNALLMQGAMAALYGSSMVGKNTENQKLMKLPTPMEAQGKRLQPLQYAGGANQSQDLYQGGVA